MKEAEFIYTIKDAISPEFCSQVIDLFESSTKKEIGVTGLGEKISRKKSIDLEITDSEDWKENRRVIIKALYRGLNEYQKLYPALSSYASMKCAGFRIHKYPIGGYFDWHIDNYSLAVSDRILAVLWYLNNLEDGHTKFMHQKVSVQPEQGKMLIFPCGFEYIHKSAVNLLDSKYVIVSFITIGS